MFEFQLDKCSTQWSITKIGPTFSGWLVAGKNKKTNKRNRVCWHLARQFEIWLARTDSGPTLWLAHRIVSIARQCENLIRSQSKKNDRLHVGQGGFPGLNCEFQAQTTRQQQVFIVLCNRWKWCGHGANRRRDVACDVACVEVSASHTDKQDWLQAS